MQYDAWYYDENHISLNVKKLTKFTDDLVLYCRVMSAKCDSL